MSRLAYKVVRWFNDGGHKGKSFDFRFTGKESRGFLKYFMFLIASVMSCVPAGSSSEFHLHVLCYLCLTLKDCVSLFSRVDITTKHVSELSVLCKRYFRTYVLFFGFHPTVWTINHVVPAHTKEMRDKYGMGLGLNSMEGKEAKHIAIKKCEHTSYHFRWQ